MFLSENVAVILLYSSFFSLIFVIFALVYRYESFYDYENSKKQMIADALKWIMLLTLASVVVYSLLSIAYHSEQQERQDFNSALKEKYTISLTEEQKQQLYHLADDINLEDELIYTTGSVKVKGRELVALWREGELYLMEFKNGSLVQIPERL